MTKDDLRASAHPHNGNLEECYYTVGLPDDARERFRSFRAVFQPRQTRTPSSSEARVDSRRRYARSTKKEPLSHFRYFGIDKPIKDDRQDEKLRASGPSCTPTRHNLEKLFSPNRGFEESVDADTRQKRKIFEKHLRGFFVDKRRHALKKYDRLHADEESAHWVSHPWSDARLRWEVVMVIVCIVNMILLPVMVAFLDYYDWWSECLVFNLFFDAIFTLDMAYNFRTGVLKRTGMQHKVSLSPVDIQRHYFHGWFTLDLISTLPFDYTLPHVIEMFSDTDFVLGARLLTLGKFLGLLRLLRVCRMVRYLTKLQTSFSSSTQWASLRMLNMVLLMLLTAHWNGCLHFLVNSCLDFPDRGWISLTGIKDASWTVQYSWCLFNSISQMLCIGYGRMAPETLVDMWFTLWGMLSGSVGFCLIIAHISSVWQQMDAPRKLHRQKMAELEDYMSYKGFESKLRSKIRDYFEQRYNGRVFDEESILASMSEPLRELIMRHSCETMISSLPFLTSAEPPFLNELVLQLKAELYQPDDIIVAYGTVGEKMFFIQSGEVTVLNHDGDILATLHEGQHFGELSILTRCERNATVKAATHCRCLTLDTADFHHVLIHFPHIEASIRKLTKDIQTMREQMKDGPSSVIRNPYVAGGEVMLFE
ncbi:potassium/sodium hyperpolarization-activated cyclic nucleotide-gated channel 2 [Galendromus occidentalis]|uniref:Potassium/sodium hyperpolarization-activated cyclic nucleotide-gated channel 2 n=1 Tax=Galendromus occidentalis TaxID=34638 RepID=A0AAJ7L5N5_9ACAR|nr:potassium/sodium hyperpolarization-activated cyclic nucleotide-gated channel 2 [Galendromus occidentalis]